MSDNRLKSLADRIERLMDERDGIQSDIRDVYAEAKSAGYVPKVLRKAITRKRMDPDKRDEEDTILDLYEDALSPSMRRAVQMAKAGATSREIETETGIDHVTVTRSVSLNKKSETPKPEDGDDGITESCGSEDAHTASPDGEGRLDERAGTLGVAPGPHDAIAEEGTDSLTPENEQPVTIGVNKTGDFAPDSLSQPVTPSDMGNPITENESPATPSVGAVASESERVAPPYPDDDPGPPPSFLRRTPAQGRA